ncbi:uncharacterized protein BX663DRAFT_523541 [Cokeromyces recurvatus]|uniref:uncharacterized protein n=1 Tax=Cokeromyces recurvatus TaxID=90255 RepID=UPI002220CE20|nr:uncharacterized protein BX663DRAFT_523541 [Cokeromyces recurvatus]KAI7898806.1 hypothetical protein BX663DRAFT_523541 [Cokeromyces recurvatus]
MNHIVSGFLKNHTANQAVNNNNNNNTNNIFGSGSWDWITNAMAFAGADALLNRYDEEHPDKNHHFLRNAGLAGALALGYQYWKDHHGRNNNQGQITEIAEQQQPAAITTTTNALVPQIPQQTIGYYYPHSTDYDPVMQLPPLPPHMLLPTQLPLAPPPPLPPHPFMMDASPYHPHMPGLTQTYPQMMPFNDMNPFIMQQQNPYMIPPYQQQQQQQNPYMIPHYHHHQQQQQQQLPYYMLGSQAMGPPLPMNSYPMASFGNNGFIPHPYYHPHMF